MVQSRGYKIFSLFNIIFFLILALVMVFPMYKVFITSIITVGEHYSSPLTLWPRTLTFDSYRFIFSSNEILKALQVTVFVTLVGTFLSMLFTLLLAYALSKNFLIGGKIIHRFLLITMFLDSGLIPFYLMVKSLGLTNNIMVNIIPALISLWNYLVIRSFFKQLPQSLEEAALIDGAGWYTVFFRIILPISMPVIATFTLFYAVGYWNTWYNAMLFCNDQSLQPLQLLLRRMVVSNERIAGMEASYSSYGESVTSRAMLYNEGVKMACCVIATFPILVVYPFLQKYFVKGVMIGAIKG
jgi:putative aldouronate transport system permease protein